MFFLPLPMKQNLETLKEAENSNKVTKFTLPNPELYIIVNGKPTKNKCIWRSLVNIKDVKAAVDKLRAINFLYNTVDESVDDAAKEVIEVSNNTTSKMLEKANESDIAGFQAYTIRHCSILD